MMTFFQKQNIFTLYFETFMAKTKDIIEATAALCIAILLLLFVFCLIGTLNTIDKLFGKPALT